MCSLYRLCMAVFHSFCTFFILWTCGMIKSRGSDVGLMFIIFSPEYLKSGLWSHILFDLGDRVLLQTGYLCLRDPHLSGDLHLCLTLEKAEV